MRMKIMDAIRLINERERQERHRMFLESPVRGHQGKKMSAEYRQIIFDMTMQGKKARDIYRALGAEYHYDTVWGYVKKVSRLGYNKRVRPFSVRV